MSEGIVQNVIQNSIEEVFLLKSIDLYFWIGKNKTPNKYILFPGKGRYQIYWERGSEINSLLINQKIAR